MKQQIIRQFLEEGILVSPDALEKIDEKNADSALEQAKSAGTIVFSPGEGEASAEETNVSVRKLQRRQKFTPQDFAAYYNSRFEGLRAILEKKLGDVLSVANARRSAGQVSAIGMVREATPRGFIMEDTTGWAEVITKSEDVAPDDVIGVRGAVKEERIFAEELIWPDVPLSRSNNRPGMKILLTDKDGHKAEEDTIVVTPEAVHGFDKKKSSLPNPGWITINKDPLAVTILVYRPDKPVTAKEAFAWLRKRHICPDRSQIRGTDDPFLIEPIPDVLWIVQAEKWKESYKGVIVVSTDGREATEVDLATGEVKAP